MSLFQRLALPFWSVLIAVILWLQVHGQGTGSLRMDVALQVRDVPTDMVIVNDLPDLVSITVTGLQAQLNSLDSNNLFVSVDASVLTMPGVLEQALDIDTIDLPVGLKVEKIQPDSVQLQVDHIVNRTVDITPVFDLPQGWESAHVVITPAVVDLSGPEVWLSTLNKIDTTAIRLDLAEGNFDIETEIVPLSGKGIHVLNKDLKIRVRGELIWTPTIEENTQPEVILDETSDDYGKAVPQEQISIVPVPAAVVEERAAQEIIQQQAQSTQPVETAPAEQKTIELVNEPTAVPAIIKDEVVAPLSIETYSQPEKLDAVRGGL